MLTSPDQYKRRTRQTLAQDLDAVVDFERKGRPRLRFKGALPHTDRLLTYIPLAKKELRLLKREINEDMKEIRAEYKKKIAEVDPPTGCLAPVGEKAKRKAAAEERRKLRAERDNILAPYRRLKIDIDHLILQLERQRVQAERSSADDSRGGK